MDGYDSDQHGGTDCNDEDASINTSADEIWYDGIDQIDELSDYDQDEDGHDDRAVDLSNSPRFVMKLHPIGEEYGNVIQGCCRS